MIRTWIKTKAAGALSRTGLDQRIGGLGQHRNAVVVGYHRVVEDFAASAGTSIPAMLISAKMLELHLDWMGRHFRFASLDEIGARLESSEPPTRALAAITFDDGYEDFYHVAFPILQRKGIPAAVFVVTDLVDTTEVQVHDRLYLLVARSRRVSQLLKSLGIALLDPLPEDPFWAARALLEALSQENLLRLMAALESEEPVPAGVFDAFHAMTWDMLRHVHKAGITIGSHTRTHVLMTNESESRLADELSGSRREIESRLETRVEHFAYPSGMFDTPAVQAVARAGYRYGYTVCSHRDPEHPSLTVPRTLLWEHSSCDFRAAFSADILACQLRGALGFVNGCSQRHSGREGGHVRR